MSGERTPQDGKGARRKGGEAVSVHPVYLTWQGLAAYSSCSKRWLQAHVPQSLRFRVDGKVLIRIRDFDAWIERYRQGQDLDRVMTEVMHGLEHSIGR